MCCHGAFMLPWLQYIVATFMWLLPSLKQLCFNCKPADFSVQFDPASYTVDEADGVVSIRIVADRPSSSTNDGAALFYTMNGTATSKRYILSLTPLTNLH